MTRRVQATTNESYTSNTYKYTAGGDTAVSETTGAAAELQ